MKSGGLKVIDLPPEEEKVIDGYEYMNIDYNPPRLTVKRDYSDQYIKKLATYMLKYFRRKDALLIEQFCLAYGLTTQKLAELASKSTSFSEALQFVKMASKTRLILHGLRNKFNTAPMAMALKNEHGYRDKPEDDSQFTTDETNKLRSLANEAMKENS